MAVRICCVCKEQKSLSCFAISKSKKLGHAYECKPCFLTKYRAKHYQDNKHIYKNRATDKKQQIRRCIEEIKSKSKCSECGQTHPATLDFHHINKNEKAFSIAEATTYGISIPRLLNEILKCVVLCANCHRILHFKELNKNASVV